MATWESSSYGPAKGCSRGEMTPYGWVPRRAPDPWVVAMLADHQRRRAEVARVEALRVYDQHIQRCLNFALKRFAAALDGSVVGTRRHHASDLSP